MIGAAFYSLSLIPVALTTSGSPPVPEVSRFSLRELYRIAPAGVVGCFATGLVNSAVIGISPLYGARLGLSIEAIGVLMANMQAGSLLLPWHLGWASARRDPHWVLVAPPPAGARPPR